LGQKVEGSVLQGGLTVHEALNRAHNEQGHPTPVRFVPQSDLPSGVAYEQFIFDTGCVPTRDGAHDFFNGLCWLLFPKLKHRLNHLQAQALALQPSNLTRGPVRDALTLVDENAAWLKAPQVLWTALVAKDWGACGRSGTSIKPRWACGCLATPCLKNWSCHASPSPPM